MDTKVSNTMANFTDSRVIYFDDYAPKPFDPDEAFGSEDADYNEAYLRQHTDSAWSLPNTPLMLTVDLAHIDAHDRELISADLEVDPEDLEYLELYVERIDGDMQYITINENRYTTIEEIPDGLRSYLDTLYFGDIENPVLTVSGARVNLWDAIRGEPETQQAFYEAGYDPNDSQLQLSGVLDAATALDKLENLGNVKLRDSLATRLIDAQVASQLLKQNQNRITAQKTKRRKFVVLSIFVSLLVAVIVSLVFING